MKKLVLALVALAALGALVFLLVSQPQTPPDDAGRGAPPGEAPAPQDAALVAEKPQAAKKPRVHEQPEAASALAVAGVVKTADGKTLAGATVEAFAVAA